MHASALREDHPGGQKQRQGEEQNTHTQKELTLPTHRQGAHTTPKLTHTPTSDQLNQTSQ